MADDFYNYVWSVNQENKENRYQFCLQDSVWELYRDISINLIFSCASDGSGHIINQYDSHYSTLASVREYLCKRVKLGVFA